MKKGLIISAFFIFGVILTLKFVPIKFENSDSFMGLITEYIRRHNDVEVICKGLDKTEVYITWNAELREPELIVAKGYKLGNIGFEYGPNRFKVILHDSLEFDIGHFKTNSRHSHDYKFIITMDSSGYEIEFIANGMDFVRTVQNFDFHGVPNGWEYSYYENGNCAYQGFYENGLKQGQFVFYHENGRIRALVNYLDDKLHGTDIDYDENGNIEFETKYINGKEIK